MITLMLMGLASIVAINIISRNTKKKIEEKNALGCKCGDDCKCSPNCKCKVSE